MPLFFSPFLKVSVYRQTCRHTFIQRQTYTERDTNHNQQQSIKKKLKNVEQLEYPCFIFIHSSRVESTLRSPSYLNALITE